MINLLPEPKQITDNGGLTSVFTSLKVQTGDSDRLPEYIDLIQKRFWNYQDIPVTAESSNEARLDVHILPSLEGILVEKQDLFEEQGYDLTISQSEVTIKYKNKAGLINAVTSVKQLLQRTEGGYQLPLCHITDYPSLPIRAIAPTFSWYAGYGRLGFDMQLWGYEEWIEFLNISLDNKINQFNMVMYGYWPFEMADYPETVLRDVPIKIWNAENKRWLTVQYTHPNLVESYLKQFIGFAHEFEVGIFAYVGLNSYNGGYTIAHPEARTKPPKDSEFVNDFDSLCLSHPGTVEYILESMREITRLGFDGFTLEESEEGFWYCECDGCKKRWHDTTSTPGEAKHKANTWLLNQIYDEVRELNEDAVIGIRAFRQPPLEKDPDFLQEAVDSMPDDIMLFWAPGLYVPEGEFVKWCDAFGRHRIWARDSEANSITSTMGRLYRTFKSNLIRYEDEINEQVIETDIRQHKGSVREGVHGINGYVFEWFGLPMHLFAHGNYGWGSDMDEDSFYRRASELNFAGMGETVLYVMQNMLTIHESQIPLYTTPFPFQKNKITKEDIPTIEAAIARHDKIMEKICELQAAADKDEKLKYWAPHFDRWNNAERRNRVIYDLVLSALEYEEESDPAEKDRLLDKILYYNEKDFDIAKEMFFDINPVRFTGVASCMFPYHEIKRIIHNIRNPENPDNDVISSGVEAFGWLWL